MAHPSIQTARPLCSNGIFTLRLFNLYPKNVHPNRGFHSLIFTSLSPSLYLSSATRWHIIFSIFGHSEQRKIAPKYKIFAKLSSHFGQILNSYSRNGKKLIKYCLSCKISPNLGTLSPSLFHNVPDSLSLSLSLSPTHVVFSSLSLYPSFTLSVCVFPMSLSLYLSFTVTHTHTQAHVLSCSNSLSLLYT